MRQLRGFLNSTWVDGQPSRTKLYNPSTGEAVAEVLEPSSSDLVAGLELARTKGGPELRQMTYAQRAEILTGMAEVNAAHAQELDELAMVNGGKTKAGAQFDVGGGTYTLQHYAELGRGIGDAKYRTDGRWLQLSSRHLQFIGQHVWVPVSGVAIGINADNFPAWSLAQKVARSILAGVSFLCKPATATALVAHRMVELWVEAGILPDGVLQLFMGDFSSHLGNLQEDDVIAFTGSAETGGRIAYHTRRIGYRFSAETDSSNAAALGPDVQDGSPTWQLFIDHAVFATTFLTGQMCTSLRRLLVPREKTQAVVDALVAELSKVVVGNPADPSVTIGPLTTADRLREVQRGLRLLRQEGRVVYEGQGSRSPVGGTPSGNFFWPTVVLVNEGIEALMSQHLEVFGPVIQITAVDPKPSVVSEVSARGGGSLVGAVYSDDVPWVTAVAQGLMGHTGRVYVANSRVDRKAPNPATVLPHLVHGGPGRAGGGEELGGLRGLEAFQRRVALEGDEWLVNAVIGTPRTREAVAAS